MIPAHRLPLLVALLFAAASFLSARAALIHRYSFTDGPKDGAGPIDGRLVGAGATITRGEPVLQNESSAAPDVTGVWDIEVVTPAGPGRPVFTFKREGEKLTGHYRGAFGEAPVTVTLSGTEIRFAVAVKAGNRDATIEYAGTVEGAAMKGRVRIGTFTEGTFTGTKRAK